MLPKFLKPAGCADCQLEKSGFGFVPASGPRHAPLLFLGESAGFQEALAGFPFIGAAGGMFSRILRRSHLERDNVRVDNCVKCRPPDDWLDGAPWEYAAINHCSQYLEETLAENHQVVIPCGGTALKTLLGLQGWDGIRVQDFHGTVHRDQRDRFWVVPTFHSSHLQRGAINLLDVVRYDISVAQRILTEGGYQRRPVSLVCDPPTDWFGRWVDTYLERLSSDPEGIWLDIDVETPDKAGGRDEGELTPDDKSAQILRVNFASNPDEGVTVPFHEAYLSSIKRALASPGVKILWNKWYDLGRFMLNQIPVNGDCWDCMWAAKHLQSDLPLGMGFWAPFYSDYGAWKHLGKIQGKEAEYGSVDGLQGLRIAFGMVKDLVEAGLWDSFYRHNHLLESTVLRPSYEVGVGVDLPRLEAFHQKLDRVAGEKLEQIKQMNIAGNLRPKGGYAKKPKGPPSRSILGKKKGTEETSKDAYVAEGATLVERVVPRDAYSCRMCGESGVSPKHKCRQFSIPSTRAEPRHPDVDGWLAAGASVVHLKTSFRIQPVPDLVSNQAEVTRWFWQLPFNPDSSQQILKYIKDTGQTPGRAKHTRKDSGDKETLKKLARKTGDLIYPTILDYKAVKKVDSTYVLGSKKRIWSDGRLHPQATFRPSMFRLSYINPNITNVVADKEGKESLAAGFRHCIVAAPGCRLLEVDFAGIEAVQTGWLSGDPNYIRLASLGVHAFLTSHLIGKPASLSWSDDDLRLYFKDIKKNFVAQYDRAKRCVHGNNYGLTVFGMVENFPDDYPTIKVAQEVQELYYAVAPKLLPLHKLLRDKAFVNGRLGGPVSLDYGQLTSTMEHHPFAYRHWFHGVLTYKPIMQAQYLRAMKQHRNDVVLINGRPFKVRYGEDSKRVIAFYPQSMAAGVLKEALLRLFHPDSQSYVGDQYYGRTPLRAPIHDSLLLEIPDQRFDYVASVVLGEMQRAIVQQPCPPEWGLGDYLKVGVSAKVGHDWMNMDDLDVTGTAPTDDADFYSLVEEEAYEEYSDLERPVERQVTLQ